MKSPLNPVLLILLLILALSACIPGPKVTPLEGDQRDQVLAYSEEMADHLLAAMNAGDYAAFSRDLAPAMVQAMPEKEFNKMLATLTPRIGAYQSRQVSRVDLIGGDIAVTYQAQYELEEEVSVRLVFSSTEPHQVTGLWFDSPNLRKK